MYVCMCTNLCINICVFEKEGFTCMDHELFMTRRQICEGLYPAYCAGHYIQHIVQGIISSILCRALYPAYKTNPKNKRIWIH